MNVCLLHICVFRNKVTKATNIYTPISCNRNKVTKATNIYISEVGIRDFHMCFQGIILFRVKFGGPNEPYVSVMVKQVVQNSQKKRQVETKRQPKKYTVNQSEEEWVCPWINGWAIEFIQNIIVNCSSMWYKVGSHRTHDWNRKGNILLDCSCKLTSKVL